MWFVFVLLMQLVELFCMFTSGKGAGLTRQERSASGEGGGSHPIRTKMKI